MTGVELTGACSGKYRLPRVQAALQCDKAYYA
jgi:hypothetical protein